MTRGSSSLSAGRCHVHPDREASARCPECRLTCCRECVTEHAGRVLCSDCLRRARAPRRERRRIIGPVLVLLLAASGFAATWLFFLLVGKMLASLPSDVHDGAIWHSGGEPP